MRLASKVDTVPCSQLARAPIDDQEACLLFGSGDDANQSEIVTIPLYLLVLAKFLHMVSNGTCSCPEAINVQYYRIQFVRRAVLYLTADPANRLK